MTDQTQPKSTPVSVFYSYARQDEALRNELEKHLSLLQRQGTIKAWHDRLIVPGTDWAQALDHYLNEASIILLLISADFLASDYCYGMEMQRAMERHAAHEARVIPIILRPVDWKGAPFATLQALPTDGKPVTNWPTSDDAFYEVAKDIRRIVHELLALAEASSRMAAGRYEQALLAYDRALQFDIHSAAAYAGKGDALLKLNRTKEALTSFDHALQLDPAWPSIDTRRGLALLGLKRSQEALEAFDQAIAINPLLAAAYSGRGEVLSHLHRYNEALDAYDQAIQLDATFAQAYVGKGRLLEQLAQEAFKEAERYGYEEETSELRDHRSHISFSNQTSAIQPEMVTLLQTIKHSHTVRVYYRPSSGSPSFHDNYSIAAVAMSPNGELCASAGYEDPKVYIYDVKTGYIVRTIQNLTSRGSFLIFSSDGQTLISNSTLEDQRTTVQMWNMETDVVTHIADVGLRCVVVDFDRQKLLGIDDAQIRMMDLQTREQLYASHLTVNMTMRIPCLALSFAGGVVVNSRYDSYHSQATLDLRDANTLKPLHLILQIEAAVALAISPDGRNLASGRSDGVVGLWRLPSGQFLHAFVAHTRDLRSVAFSPDGQKLITGSDDGTIKIWEVK